MQRLKLFLFFPLFQFVEPRFQDCHCHGLVSVLRAVLLALNHDVCRHVGDAYSGVGLVDMLSSGAA